MSHIVQGGAGTSHDQVFSFPPEVVASVSLASPDGVVRTVTALYN